VGPILTGVPVDPSSDQDAASKVSLPKGLQRLAAMSDEYADHARCDRCAHAFLSAITAPAMQ
jgi:hypothetical protein